jgi:hypothetical protein
MLTFLGFPVVTQIETAPTGVRLIERNPGRLTGSGKGEQVLEGSGAMTRNAKACTFLQ